MYACILVCVYICAKNSTTRMKSITCSRPLFCLMYRASQKFVPPISRTIIFDQNLFLHEIFRRCLFLYREHMFIISVTGMPFFFFFSHSVAVAAWCGTRRVDPQMIHFELFYQPVRRSQFNPQTIFV